LFQPILKGLNELHFSLKNFTLHAILMQICSNNGGRKFIEKYKEVLQVPVVLKHGPNL